ncbi:hypothetical protein LQ772_06620 [Frateuria edaphi]|uniref:hypothetical protein n=1 Tax=Frateuria edaphi TaxID=2898793 RepID=UPI001E4CED70|nr:hypothetical protein [Frateuria edaphi]UGB46959.1 hypothetical protein LQ772_06620 [Frateuria edaphi]
MREKELRQHAVCSLCEQPIGRAGVPMFWVVKIERHGLKVDVLMRQQGLAMQLGGNGFLAQVMGPDEEMTTPIGEASTLTVCLTCATDRALPVSAMEGVVQDEDYAERVPR